MDEAYAGILEISLDELISVSSSDVPELYTSPNGSDCSVGGKIG